MAGTHRPDAAQPPEMQEAPPTTADHCAHTCGQCSLCGHYHCAMARCAEDQEAQMAADEKVSQVLYLWPDGSITGVEEVWAFEMALAEEARNRWTRRLRRWLREQLTGPTPARS